MSVVYTLAGALLGALAYRFRGTARFKWWGRGTCALLIALPAAFYWPWGTLAYLPLAGASLWAVSRPHDPGAAGWQELLKMSLTGLVFTAPATVALILLGGYWQAALMAAAGSAKGLAYLLPRGPEPDNKYLWKEAAFGCLWGAAMGAAL